MYIGIVLPGYRTPSRHMPSLADRRRWFVQFNPRCAGGMTRSAINDGIRFFKKRKDDARFLIRRWYSIIARYWHWSINPRIIRPWIRTPILRQRSRNPLSFFHVDDVSSDQSVTGSEVSKSAVFSRRARNRSAGPSRAVSLSFGCLARYRMPLLAVTRWHPIIRDGLHVAMNRRCLGATTYLGICVNLSGSCNSFYVRDAIGRWMEGSRGYTLDDDFSWTAM